jgi:hypothetical protein
MEKMELYDYYNLDECVDRKKVISVLKKLKKEGKINYSLDGEILKFEDLELDDLELKNLSDLFDENAVFPEVDKEEDDDDDYYDFEDYDDDY